MRKLKKITDYDISNWEVVGNIHDNEELVEKKGEQNEQRRKSKISI